MRSVLVTGATGSFGRAFIRYLLVSGDQPPPDRIVCFSRGEHAQADMAADLAKDDDRSRLRFLIGDVRDRDRLRRAFEGVDVVVHAAALKRIEVGHYNPIEMVKTNVLGAMNIIEAAHDAGVQRVIGLSSDKAWQPVSPYGQSKAVMESLFLAANETRGYKGPTHAITRYGNVWMSAGSVVLKWKRILRRGGPVPVTDPEATRFFMSMPEAVSLVMLAIKGRGDHYIPESLPAYRLADLAEAMGAEMDIRGLPEYEKKHEGLRDGVTSDKARRLTVEHLSQALVHPNRPEWLT